MWRSSVFPERRTRPSSNTSLRQCRSESFESLECSRHVRSIHYTVIVVDADILIVPDRTSSAWSMASAVCDPH
jgi:hypothetical protein